MVTIRWPPEWMWCPPDWAGLRPCRCTSPNLTRKENSGRESNRGPRHVWKDRWPPDHLLTIRFWDRDFPELHRTTEKTQTKLVKTCFKMAVSQADIMCLIQMHVNTFFLFKQLLTSIVEPLAFLFYQHVMFVFPWVTIVIVNNSDQFKIILLLIHISNRHLWTNIHMRWDYVHTFNLSRYM